MVALVFGEEHKKHHLCEHIGAKQSSAFILLTTGLLHAEVFATSPMLFTTLLMLKKTGNFVGNGVE
ncbi:MULTISPECIES: hypothetical protein [Nitrosomonas]|uniref:Uncharacterized protein n=1 Tax=Nitrosomonas eutropha TaxID=916 RepID=A0ABX5MD35_9PROT|nr:MULTISPECIES: hypothetical protein [Nitrosomonas]MXS81037.1 hypothetical protein [Nitrosomonas sp. GH22]PXV83931.1 hypothetical protein C8R14_10248 [Nitrosomonas eutropha]